MTDSSRTPTVAITGVTGLIGSAVLRECRETRVRVLVRSPQRGLQNVDLVLGDIRDRASTMALLDGVHTLLHCASYIGRDSELASSVNDAGTRQLVAAAAVAGVSRIVYVSTTGVYGDGPFVGATEAAPLFPTSETSRTKALAEGHILAANGTVIRPHLVYGIGDTRVVPAAFRVLHAIGGSPRPSPLVSAISAGQLASQVWEVAANSDMGGRAVNADHGVPVRLLELVARAGDISGLRRMPAHKAFNAALAAGVSEHQARMLTAHSYFTSTIRGIVDTRSGDIDNPHIWGRYQENLAGLTREWR